MMMASQVSTPSGRTLFFSSPASNAAREKLTLRRSDDAGATWPKSLLLWDGPAAYSSMRLLPDGAHLGVLYERGEGPRLPPRPRPHQHHIALERDETWSPYLTVT